MSSQPDKKKSHWPISILASFSALFNAAVPLVFARILAPEQVGHYKIFFLYLMIFPAFSFTHGIVSGLAYWAGRASKREAALQFSALAILVAGAIVGALVWLLSPLLTHHLEWDPAYSQLFAVSLFGTIVVMYFEEAAIVTGRIWTGALYHFSFESVRTVATLIAAYLTRDLYFIFLVHTGFVLINACAGYAFAWSLKLVRFARFNKDTVREVLKYAIPVSGAWIFGIFTQNADQFILSTYIDPADFAVYSFGCLVVPPLIILEKSVTRVLIPQLSEAFDQSLPERAALYFSRAVEQMSFIFVPAVVGLIIFAEPIVLLLFTEKYSAAIPFLRVFAISYFLMIIPWDSVARARGQGGWIFKNFVGFSIFSLTIIYFLTLKMGAMGALIGMLITRAAMKVFSILYLRANLNWHLSHFLPLTNLARFLVVAFILGVPSFLAKDFFDQPLIWFLTIGPIFTLGYFLLVSLWKNLSPAEEYRHEKVERVIMVTQYLGIGGIEKMVLNLSQALKNSKKWKVIVFAFDQAVRLKEKSLIPLFEKNGIEVIAHHKHKGFSFRAVTVLIRLIYKNDIQVIHSHDLSGLIYAVFAKLFSLRPVRLVHTQHSFVHLTREKRYQLYERFFTKFVDYLTVVSPGTKEKYLELGVSNRKMSVIPNGVSFPDSQLRDRSEKLIKRNELIRTLDSATCDRLTQLKDKVWLLYLSRIHPVKGHRHAVDIWNKMDPEIRKSCALVFVGPPSEPAELEKLEKAISQSSDLANIVYGGSTHDPMKWFLASDVYLSFSDFEGMPLGPLEAMGAGLPAIISDIEAHQHLKNDARLVQTSDLRISAQTIEELVRHISSKPSAVAYTELWENSSWIRREYSIDHMAKQYAKLYGKNIE